MSDTKAKSKGTLSQVQAAERDVDRWRKQIARLEGRATEALAGAEGAARSLREIALSAHVEGGQATSTLPDLRRTASEAAAGAEELSGTVELAKEKLSEAEKTLAQAQHAAVEKLAKQATESVEAKREAVFDAIEQLGMALAELDATAQRAAGLTATLSGVYTPAQALAGQVGADLQHYRRLMPAHAIAQKVKEVCAPHLRDSWPP